MPLAIREIKFDSSEYLASVDLRYRILREPLGLTFKPEDRIQDKEDIHLGAFDDDRLVGTLTLTRLTTNDIKMRQVAVDADQQGRGVGRMLVEASETYARGNGFTQILLNARDTAVPFYERLGYTTAPGAFNEVGIPHKKMFKAIGSV